MILHCLLKYSVTYLSIILSLSLVVPYLDNWDNTIKTYRPWRSSFTPEHSSHRNGLPVGCWQLYLASKNTLNSNSSSNSCNFGDCFWRVNTDEPDSVIMHGYKNSPQSVQYRAVSSSSNSSLVALFCLIRRYTVDGRKRFLPVSLHLFGSIWRQEFFSLFPLIKICFRFCCVCTVQYR